ncbi:MAG: 6-hydroxypseudooxynicotine dehydrogenase complex subunit alpha [Acidimicrobiales bacterium]|nr:MAG: xanthine dehydrogenase family protein subunit M [Actinomycetota bacterium]MBV6510166.1 6-hydroxypseudooxynicotine dehydrogenase complex subunit alpha [Acidimicrobiales bacterium]RIK02362.1 MAG: molybdopterin dehydrogenase [Acidobacteriota bacterium]
MKPAPLDYAAPTSLTEAVTLLSDGDRDCIVIAGGQSLMPMLNMRLARPDLLVDLSRIADLDYIRDDGATLAIGAMTTKRAVEHSAVVAERQPLLHAATCLVGHPQIRNRGTVGGSLAHADPAAEYPAVAVATDSEMRVLGPAGERRIGAADFFVGYLTTALAPGEVIVEVIVPVLGAGTGWGLAEFSRRHGDFAIAGAAVTVELDSDRCCSQVRIVLFGVAATPVRLAQVEDLLRGEAPEGDFYRRAGEAVSEALDQPLSDVQASADYRRHLAGVLSRRGLAEAVGRAAERAGRSRP